ncbi:dihydrodipicolinate synthase family protein [Hwanghaeella sp.]|uniref:dihydrodipicolinate synthase family protein n=1 Tax=Hwanghaeella sp. TaxID=2605943 RepID=UPI003CCBD0AC
MTDTSPARFRGVLVPASTPFAADLSPDAGRFNAFCSWLLDEGADGLAIFGTTSEANSVGMADRMRLTEGLVESGVPAAKLLPGTGMCALADSVAMTKHAVELGCGGVLVLPPFYYKNPSDDGLYASFAELIERVGDKRLQLYLYHFPQMAGVGIPMGVIERLVKAYPETVGGLKDSSGDWSNTEAVIKNFPSLHTFPSSESRAVDALKIGGAGCISASANINVRAIRALIDVWDKPEADALNEKVSAVRGIMEGYPIIAAVKAVLAEFGGDEEWNRVSPPLVTLPAEKRAALISALKAEGFSLSMPVSKAA